MRPREIPKVAGVQQKKVQSKFLESAIFDLYKRFAPQKKLRTIQILNKIRGFCNEKVEKKS